MRTVTLFLATLVAVLHHSSASAQTLVPAPYELSPTLEFFVGIGGTCTGMGCPSAPILLGTEFPVTTSFSASGVGVSTSGMATVDSPAPGVLTMRIDGTMSVIGFGPNFENISDRPRSHSA